MHLCQEQAPADPSVIVSLLPSSVFLYGDLLFLLHALSKLYNLFPSLLVLPRVFTCCSIDEFEIFWLYKMLLNKSSLLAFITLALSHVFSDASLTPEPLVVPFRPRASLTGPDGVFD